MKLMLWNQISTALLIGFTFVPGSVLSAQATPPSPDRVRTVLTTPLPPTMRGDSLHTTLTVVRYGPGEASPSHQHNCPVIVYVLEGKLRSQIGGQQEIIYSAGDSFYEAPGGLHAVSANASDEKPARFLAFHVCDHDESISGVPPRATSGTK